MAQAHGSGLSGTNWFGAKNQPVPVNTEAELFFQNKFTSADFRYFLLLGYAFPPLAFVLELSLAKRNLV